MNIEGVGSIVTGAASGMGYATAVALRRSGARVALLDIDRPGVERAADRIGGRAFVCNVADPMSTARAVQAACAALSPVRVVVTCAGIGRMEPIVCSEGDATLARMLETIQINLLGTLNVVRLAVNAMIAEPALRDGARGVVIMVGSTAAHDGPAASSAYSASKGGVVSMTVPLARELGDYGIRVNTISPGAFATPMLANLPKPLLEEVLRITPFPKRPGQAEEFAELALHICRNEFLNGAVIRLDGASRAPYYSLSPLGSGAAAQT
jgi:NAD(P)-dependent dehydrogenase (short-subunit alcohol dehydrogenase family)